MGKKSNNKNSKKEHKKTENKIKKSTVLRPKTMEEFKASIKT